MHVAHSDCIDATFSPQFEDRSTNSAVPTGMMNGTVSESETPTTGGYYGGESSQSLGEQPENTPKMN
jgi:hypothetical protein